MLHFESDYLTGAHPEILRRLAEINGEAQPGYGDDAYCLSAAEKIRQSIGLPQAEIYFLMGGTQTNQVVITTLLAPSAGVLTPVSGHISLHEAGAIEHGGHKVLALPARDGKLEACCLRKALQDFAEDENRDFMVEPGLLYLSYPTEYGTLYTKAELTALHEICLEYGIPLYIDGARLGYGLASRACDLTLPELAGLCEVFYIGGTKMGALCGEALVFTGMKAPHRFGALMKQQGALLAKGRLLGAQFDALFTDGLYRRIGEHGIKMAERLKDILIRKGYPLYIDSPTNQQFPILTGAQLERLKGKLGFCFWEKAGEDRTVVRLATCWSTTEEQLDALEQLL